MCGIFVYLTNNIKINKLILDGKKINHRGPDNCMYYKLTKDIFVMFHRLMINGTCEKSNQPMVIGNSVLLCNGEIYNHKSIMLNLQKKSVSESDCECIMHSLYHSSPVEACRNLDGVFAFVYIQDKDIIAARDFMGVRPLFYGVNLKFKIIAFASEAKCLMSNDEIVKIHPFPPGHIYIDEIIVPFRKIDDFPPPVLKLSIYTHMRSFIKTIYSAIKKRMIIDIGNIGCFLSGGLDSSIITALVVAECKRLERKPPELFSIGLENSNSPDLRAATIVAEYLDLPLHKVTYSLEEGIDALKITIFHLESWDCTTVRASTPQYLLAKYVKQNTDCKVLFSGEGADELFLGYQYFKRAPSPWEATKEGIELLQNLYLYDVLRTDRTVAAHGLEVRVPFLDFSVVRSFLEIPHELRIPSKDGIEKIFVRKAIEKFMPKLLPTQILWRPKDAFSDAVGYSWIDGLKKHADKTIKDSEFDNFNNKVMFPTKEHLLYKKIFDEFFGKKNEHLIPKHWMPNLDWFRENMKDPSARVLPCYEN